MNQYKYTCSDVRYAVDNYAVMLYVSLPDLYEGKSIGIALVAKQAKNIYNMLTISTVDTDIAYSFGQTEPYDISLPNGIVLGCNRYYTQEQLDYIVSISTRATIIEDYGGNYLNDDKITKTLIGYDFSKIVSKLTELNKVNIRYTDHEYREDVRDMTYIEGYYLPCSISVESVLQYDNSPLSPLQQHLINLLD